MKFVGTQISIVKLNMSLELYVIYGYAVMYFPNIVSYCS